MKPQGFNCANEIVTQNVYIIQDQSIIINPSFSKSLPTMPLKNGHLPSNCLNNNTQFEQKPYTKST